MISDKQRQLLAHPIRPILKRAASMGSLPDEQELAGLDVDDRTRAKVREAARQVSDVAASGGMRSRHHAAQVAERLSVELAQAVPREYAASVPVDRDDDGPDSHTLAERIIARRGAHPTAAESAEERAVRMEALRIINHKPHAGDE